MNFRRFISITGGAKNDRKQFIYLKVEVRHDHSVIEIIKNFIYNIGVEIQNLKEII